MRFLFRFVDLRPLVGFACLAGLLPAGVASERVAEALREKLPRYDPAIRADEERRLAQEAGKKAAEPEPATPPAVESKSPAPPETAPGVVVLDPVEVRALRQVPRVKLPRIDVSAPIDSSVDTEDPYLLPGERRARLQKKHLSALDRALNKFSFGFGLFSSGDARAAAAENREQFARGAAEIADAIQLAALAGEDEAEIEKLRQLYLQLLMARPK